jgi:hypothetical protein
MINESELVCIVWRDSPTDTGFVDTLVYGDGKVRTYRKDRIDPRTGETVFVGSFAEAAVRLQRGDGTKLAVPVTVARVIGPTWVFDRP